MTNPLYVAREIEHQWNDAGCTVAITADFLFAQRVAGIRSRLPVQHYVIASIPDYLCFPLNLLAPLKLRRAKPPLMASVHAGPGVHFMRRLIRTTPANPPRAAIDMDEPAALQYTGGTTGVAERGRPDASQSVVQRRDASSPRASYSPASIGERIPPSGCRDGAVRGPHGGAARSGIGPEGANRASRS